MKNRYQNLVMRSGGNPQALYYACRGEVREMEDGLRLDPGAEVDFDGYFNALFACVPVQLSSLRRMRLCLRLSGSGAVRLQRRDANGSVRTVVEQHYTTLQDEEVFLDLNLSGDDENARFYPQVVATDSSLHVHEGGWIACQDEMRPVHLNVVICTHRKQEYLEKNVKALLEYAPLRSESWSLLVVDNASEIPPDFFPHPRVRVIQQQNVGGAGGFTRGLMESMRGEATHVLFMDDDAITPPESVYRILQVHRHANRECCFGGAMLDLYRPHEMWESCAHIQLQDIRTLVSHHNRWPLDDPRKLDDLCVLEKPKSTQFCGWWFFSLPVDAAKSCGLPLPCFIRGDDQEYGIRLFAKGFPSYPFPGVGTWHEAFYAKPATWITYFIVYNQLLLASFHEYWAFDHLVHAMEDHVSRALVLADYGSVEQALNAMEDYLKGPEHLMNSIPSTRLERALATSRQHQLEQIPYAEKPTIHYPHRLGITCLLCTILRGNKNAERAIRILSILGLRRKRIVVPKRRLTWRHGLIADEVVVVPAVEQPCLVLRFKQKERDRLLARANQVMASFKNNGKKASAEFKASFGKLTSHEFWETYLHINR
jgi:galactofuranosylgalactofuranosylrhamnosyl-N-acetylglucosaminyl-diphospho-decaprenol beta-1,5/1,6-galactofuranosyltransferase